MYGYALVTSCTVADSCGRHTLRRVRASDWRQQLQKYNSNTTVARVVGINTTVARVVGINTTVARG